MEIKKEDEEMEEYLEDEEEDTIEHEFKNVAVKVLSKAPCLRYYILELGRLTGMEVEWLEKMAKWSGILHGSEAREWDVTNGNVISTYIDELGFRAARICIYDSQYKRPDKRPDVGTVMDSANITLHASTGNIRMSLINIEVNNSSNNTSSANWFGKVGKWGEEAEEKEEPKMNTPDGYYFRHVALKVERNIGCNWYVVRIGRINEDERTNLERISKNLNSESISPCGDPTEGKVIFSSELRTFSEATLCVHSARNWEVGATYDGCHFRLETGGSRLELKDFLVIAGSLADAITCRNWFEKHGVFGVREVVVCNRGSSGLQIGRLDDNERHRFDAFAGKYGSALDGRIDRLLTDESGLRNNDRVLKNVSFAEGLEFKPGESICLSYIKIEKTGNEFKVVTARRNVEENVEERWHLASAKKDGPIKVTFTNVAVKVTKKVGSLDYYILEIGRLSTDELERLEKVYRNVGDYNGGTHEMDETKGKVLSRDVRVVDSDGEPWTYHVTKVCVYWPEYTGRSKNVIGKVIDSAEITLESHHGNFRPTLEKMEEHEEIHNQYSGRWFEKFPFEEKDNGPLKIRLNNVVAVAITHRCDDIYGIKTTVEFSLARCRNYHQAVEDIGKALTIRFGEPSRVSWNPHTKRLTVAIQDDTSRIEDMYLRVCPFMIELQYDADLGTWGINMMHEVFEIPSRCNGKKAELKRMLNAAYGMRCGIMPEGTDFDGDVLAYCRADVAIQESMWRRAKKFEEETMKARMPEITNIEFRDPATIVFWSDGTKTVVRCQNGEKYDPEKGMAMAVCRKVYGNERDYYHLFLHWMKKARKIEVQKKDEKPAAVKKTPAKKPKTAPKKKGWTKK